MSDIITCEVCGMRMTKQQEQGATRCLVVACPLPNAGPAGASYAKAKKQDRDKMGGIIIGMRGHKLHQTAGDAT